jgi:RHS repeat-associated protein
VTTYGYDAAGNQNAVTDLRGIESLTVFDMLGQQTETIADYTDGTPTSDSNQTTTYTYDGNGDVITMTADMPSGTNSQTTDYIYGVGTTGGLFSNDLIAKVEYPDPSTGDASTAAANDVSYTYDNLGETLTKTDQNGSVHSYSYDAMGRLTLDAVTTLASGVNGNVMALGYSYNALGLPYQQTSYNSATVFSTGNIVNQDQDAYNGLGQLVGEYQSVSGAFVTSGGSITPEVQYGYSSLSTGSNLASMTYPNGRALDYGYNTGLDSAIGRISYLADAAGSGDSTHLVDYSYQGLGTFVGESMGNGVAETTTLDNFGRIASMAYVNSASTVLDSFSYGYDADGNVLSKTNGVNAAFSELYTYDNLNRLTSFQRGTISGGTIASPAASQSWSLDAVGNQTATTTDGTTVTRSANSQNELTGVGSSTLGYDNNGNTTTDESGHTLTYDAWNRLVTDSAGTTSYTYDANGRRITETHGDTTTNLYFTTQGQVIEERAASPGTVTAQSVWGIDYVNSLVVRDDNTTSGNLGLTGSGLGTRTYYQHDANWNVTATVDTSGDVINRYVYTPYGVQSVLTGVWTTSSGSNSEYGFQGGRFDISTGMHRFGARDYDPATGTWREQDPAGYVDGANVYRLEDDGPIIFCDPSGLAPDPNWNVQIPNDPSSVSDPNLAAQYRDEAYNRGAYYWDQKGLDAPASWAGNVGGWNINTNNPNDRAAMAASYSKENQKWDGISKDWQKRLDELMEPNRIFRRWRSKNPHAHYGSPCSGPTIGPRDSLPPGVTPVTIVRPPGRAVRDALQAAMIGKGGIGSPGLGDVDSSDGYAASNKFRDKYRDKYNGRGQIKETNSVGGSGPQNELNDAKGSAAATGVQGAAAALQELLNGMNSLTILYWERDGCSGYYAPALDAETAEMVIKLWLGL